MFLTESSCPIQVDAFVFSNFLLICGMLPKRLLRCYYNVLFES
jgi:hypothetical protein